MARLDVLMERVDTLASTVATTASAIAKKDGEIAGLRRDLEARDQTVQSLVAHAHATRAISGEPRRGRQRAPLPQERRRVAHEGARGRRVDACGAARCKPPLARTARRGDLERDRDDGSGWRRRRAHRDAGSSARVTPRNRRATRVGARSSLRRADRDARDLALAGRGARRPRLGRDSGAARRPPCRHGGRARTARGAHRLACGQASSRPRRAWARRSATS